MRRLLVLSGLMHAAFLGFGLWQDAQAEQGDAQTMKYTDIDYAVFTDAATHVAEGRSPYERHTYRYTPALAYLLLGNVHLCSWFGKAVFAAFDLATGQLIFELTGGSRLLASVWLFSPIAVNVATRGSCDAIICCLMLLFIKCFEQRQLDKAAFVLGLAVHFRLFPIVFGVPVLWRLANRGVWPVVRFAGIGGSVFLGLVALFYQMYGWEFLHETYLYHFTRRDHRHNFSLFFYPTYLSGGVSGAAAVAAAGAGALQGLQLLLPQVGALVLVGSLRNRSLAVNVLLQTLVFVTFNRVITAQYFVWYGCLIPLAVPQLRSDRKGVFAAALIAWLAAKLHWLYWAFALEVEGRDVFLGVHIASVLFFCTHIALICVLIDGTRQASDRVVQPPPALSAPSSPRSPPAGARSRGRPPRSNQTK